MSTAAYWEQHDVECADELAAMLGFRAVLGVSAPWGSCPRCGSDACCCISPAGISCDICKLSLNLDEALFIYSDNPETKAERIAEFVERGLIPPRDEEAWRAADVAWRATEVGRQFAVGRAMSPGEPPAPGPTVSPAATEPEDDSSGDAAPGPTGAPPMDGPELEPPEEEQGRAKGFEELVRLAVERECKPGWAARKHLVRTTGKADGPRLALLQDREAAMRANLANAADDDEWYLEQPECLVPDFKLEHLELPAETGPAPEPEATSGDAAPAERRPDPPPEPEQGGTAPGTHEAPPSDEIVLDPRDPYPGARSFLQRHHQLESQRTLHDHAGVFYAYDGAAYRARENAAVRSELWEFASHAKTWKKDAAELAPFRPTTTKLNNLLDAVRGVAHLSAEHSPPCWLEARDGDPPASELIAGPNGLLHVPSRALYPSSPRLFTLHALPFPYDPRPPEPTRWIRFLHELWGDDEGKVDDEAVNTLQEIFGYVLLPDTRLQKIFLLVGPKRSGKGTIGRVLSALLGHANVCAPTLSSLSTNFGLWPLIGRLLAIVSDARLGARADQAAIAERLLSISGEDTMTIDRKHLPPWTGHLLTRFLILTNELPRVQDTSGALASRFVVMALRESFYGREDPNLTTELLAELPGILAWSLDGWDRLHARGRFVQPESAMDAVGELEDLGSPVAAFIRDRCVVGAGHTVEIKELYKAWTDWCREQGREHPGTQQSFGRDLRAILPGLTRTQPRWGGGRVGMYEGIGLKERPL